MDFKDISSYRLAHQQISFHHSKTPLDVVTHLGALQAQDYPGALWSIGLRLPASTKEDIEKAIKERQIVRTWPMRGTLHFIPAVDAQWMLELMAPRVIANSAYRVRNLELSDVIFAQSNKIVVKALQGNRQISRSCLLQILEDNGILVKNQRGNHILWRLSLEGLLCFGPHEDKEPTFALLSEWVPNAKKLSREEALATITLRYFESHGPATMKDFMGWTGLTSGDAKNGLEMVKEKLVSETIENTVYYMSLENVSKLKNTSSLYLLPGFDEYLLGYKDRSAVLPTHHSQKIVPGNNGMFLATIIINGIVSGLWKKKVKKNSIEIIPQLFDETSKLDKQLFTSAVKGYQEFLGMSKNT